MADEINTPQGTDGSGYLSTQQAQTAIGRLLDPEPDTPEQAESTETPDAEDHSEADGEDVVEAQASDDDAEADDEEETPSDESDSDDDEPEDPVGLYRLPDGSEVTLEELQKGYLRQSDYTRKRQQEAEQAKALGQREQALQQQSQFFEQVLPVAIHAAQINMPQPPSPDLLQSDPFEYVRQEKHFEAKQRELQQLMGAQQHYSQTQQAQQKQHMDQLIREERSKLEQSVPEWKDATKRGEIRAQLSDTIKHYGFDEAEIDGVFDSRVILALRDLAKYRKMMANKPKVEAKAKDAPPVAKPGKRPSRDEKKVSSRRDKLDKLRRTGDRHIGQSLIADML